MRNHDDAHEQDPLEQLGYEKRDLPLKRAPLGAVIFFVGLVVTLAGTWVFMWLIARERTLVPTDGSMVRQRMPEAPNPLLQSNITAAKDMADLRNRELNHVGSYGWVDKEKGIAHVPVDRAMELVLADGMDKKDTPDVLQRSEMTQQ